jgi:hypothetical protein
MRDNQELYKKPVLTVFGSVGEITEDCGLLAPDGFGGSGDCGSQ